MTQQLTREDAIARVRAAIARGYPRAVVLFILALSGGVAFLFSAGTLRLGFEHMGVRYLLAALVGYAAFLLLIRAWITYRRGFDDDGDSAVDVADAASNFAGDGSHGNGLSTQEHPPVEMFAGGRSGGGGAGATWGKSSVVESSALDFDADELWPVVLAVICTIGALFALVYVVWAAPLLLAEIALDAAVVGGLYRRLRREDARHWLDAALRRTWMPAAAISLTLMTVGFAAQWAVPTAQSIGDVVRELSLPD
jgi:hypothetical protein